MHHDTDLWTSRHYVLQVSQFAGQGDGMRNFYFLALRGGGRIIALFLRNGHLDRTKANTKLTNKRTVSVGCQVFDGELNSM